MLLVSPVLLSCILYLNEMGPDVVVHFVHLILANVAVI
jgi:hypothetical protein